jgi:L-glyceraldehyde 3-phosphate reductase
MGFDHVDLIYANPPPSGLPVADMVAAVGELLSSGRTRAWGIVNWEAEQFLEASQAAASLGVPQPCAAQLPYSVVRRDWVESTSMDEALGSSGAGVVASFVMAGGVLTGKYDAGETGRAAAEIDDPRLAAARERGRALQAVAAELGVAPATCAIAFALANPVVTTVLFGATSAAQIEQNATALDVDAAAVRRALDG